jgi:hypothetical protein
MERRGERLTGVPRRQQQRMIGGDVGAAVVVDQLHQMGM